MEKDTIGEKWYIGDSYHSAIGQGFITVTPLQLANYTAAIANGGTLFSPKIVNKIKKSNGEEELIKPGMRIEPVVGLPELPSVDSAAPLDLKPVEEIEVSVLIIGGGPAGLSAAIELGRRAVDCLLVDDKHRLGENWYFKPIVSSVRWKQSMPVPGELTLPPGWKKRCANILR